MPACREVLKELALDVVVELLQPQSPIGSTRIDALPPEPLLPFLPPAFKHLGRNRIVSPPSDEAHDPRLRPMWQSSFNDSELGVRIKAVQFHDEPK